MTAPSNASLFDDEWGNEVSVVESRARGKPATKAQRLFNQLVTAIGRLREKLKRWQDFLPRYNQRLSTEMAPLRLQLRAGQRRMVDLVDELLSRPAPGRRLANRERAKLRHLLATLLLDILADGDDPKLEALYDKYNDVPLAQVRQSEMKLTEVMLDNVFGLDVGDEHGASSTEDLLRHAQRTMEERIEDEARQAEAADAERAGKRSRSGTAKAAAAQAKREQAEREIGQSLREVYRKLASALHPDREPDAGARQRKTLMMQRVNQAYAANDLLTLLGLQLEIEQIDAAHITNVSPQRLAHYNQILREQVADLEAELESCVLPFREQFDLDWDLALTPASVDQRLSAELAELRETLRDLEADLVTFRDPDRLRAALKHYDPEQDLDEGVGELNELLDSILGSAPAPRGKKRRRG